MSASSAMAWRVLYSFLFMTKCEQIKFQESGGEIVHSLAKQNLKLFTKEERYCNEKKNKYSNNIVRNTS